MGKMEKIVSVGKELLNKVGPVVETVKRKTIENIPKLIEFCSGVKEKILEKADGLIESGKKSYESIASKMGADSEMVEEVEKETGTLQKLKGIKERVLSLARETVKKVFDVVKKRMPNEIGAIGDIDALKKEMGLDLESEQQEGGQQEEKQEEREERKKKMDPSSNLNEIKTPELGFKEKVDAANAEELKRYQGLSPEEQEKIEPFKLPLAVREERDRQQMERELEAIERGEWKPAQSEYSNPKKWLGMDGETASKRLHELEVARSRALLNDIKEKNNTVVPEKPPVLEKIQEEERAKKQQKQEEIAKIIETETELAQKGEWDRFKSDLIRHSYSGVIDDLETLGRINEEGKEKRRKEETEKELGEINDAYQKEREQAMSGEWDETKSYFNKGRIPNKHGEREKRGELYEMNRKAKERIKAERYEAEKKEYPLRYVEEAAQARAGKWDSQKSFFFRRSDEEASSRWNELRRINEESKESKKKTGREFSSNQQEDMEKQALQKLNLQEGHFNKDDLQKAFRKFSLKSHPDKLASQDLTEEERTKKLEEFQVVSSGYDSLMKKMKENR